MNLPAIAAVFIDKTPHGSMSYRIKWDTPAWRASCEWARFHGIDPCMVPEGTEIVRDVAGCCVHYWAFVVDDEGRVAMVDDGPVIEQRTEQGEAPPLPFPSEVLEAL